MRRGREHLDVGAGAEELVERAGDDDRLHGRVLETQTLERVVQLDVDAEVVGVELQLVVVTEAAARVDGHRQRGDRRIDVELPVPVTGRLGVEADRLSLHVSIVPPNTRP